MFPLGNQFHFAKVKMLLGGQGKKEKQSLLARRALVPQQWRCQRGRRGRRRELPCGPGHRLRHGERRRPRHAGKREVDRGRLQRRLPRDRRRRRRRRRRVLLQPALLLLLLLQSVVADVKVLLLVELLENVRHGDPSPNGARHGAAAAVCCRSHRCCCRRRRRRKLALNYRHHCKICRANRRKSSVTAPLSSGRLASLDGR